VRSKTISLGKQFHLAPKGTRASRCRKRRQGSLESSKATNRQGDRRGTSRKHPNGAQHSARLFRVIRLRQHGPLVEMKRLVRFYPRNNGEIEQLPSCWANPQAPKALSFRKEKEHKTRPSTDWALIRFLGADHTSAL